MRYYLAALATIVALSSACLYADPVGYTHTGTVAPTVTTTATSSSVDAYFYSSSAADNDTISLYDVTTSSFLSPGNILPNHASTPGSEVTFSGASIGDQIVFELSNSVYPGKVFASDPALSTDGINHSYITNFDGKIPGSSVTISGPALYIGMEDLPKGSTDLDYNDDNFIATGVSTTPAVPEPSSIVLLGTGLLAAAGAVRRKFDC
jgi:hypothetical protein